MRVILNLTYGVPHLGHSNRKCFNLGKHIQLCCPMERMFPALWQAWSSDSHPWDLGDCNHVFSSTVKITQPAHPQSCSPFSRSSQPLSPELTAPSPGAHSPLSRSSQPLSSAQPLSRHGPGRTSVSTGGGGSSLSGSGSRANASSAALREREHWNHWIIKAGGDL